MLVGTMIVIHVAACNEQNGKLSSENACDNNKNKSHWLEENLNYDMD